MNKVLKSGILSSIIISLLLFLCFAMLNLYAWIEGSVKNVKVRF